MVLTNCGSASFFTNIAIFSLSTHASSAPNGQKTAHNPHSMQVFTSMSTRGKWTNLPFSITAGLIFTDPFGHSSAQTPHPLHKSRFKVSDCRPPSILLSRRNLPSFSCLDMSPIIIVHTQEVFAARLTWSLHTTCTFNLSLLLYLLNLTL